MSILFKNIAIAMVIIPGLQAMEVDDRGVESKKRTLTEKQNPYKMWALSQYVNEDEI